MRTPSGLAALLACAVLTPAIGGCAPSPKESTASTTTVSKPASSSPVVGTTATSSPSTTPVGVAATSSPAAASETKPTRPASQLAELIVLEGELRLKLNASANPAEREVLARRIVETEKQRIALYQSLTAKENVR